MKLQRLLPLGGVVLLAACSGQASTYAGMTPYEAATEAADIISDEALKPSSEIHGLHPRLAKMVRDHMEGGDEAWYGVFDTEGPRVCVLVWADVTAMSTTYNYDFGPCPKRIVRAKGELGAKS